jgi:hypothetical protein
MKKPTRHMGAVTALRRDTGTGQVELLGTVVDDPQHGAILRPVAQRVRKSFTSWQAIGDITIGAIAKVSVSGDRVVHMRIVVSGGQNGR